MQVHVSLLVRLLGFGAVAVVGVGLALLLYTIASTPSRVASRLGLRGLKRQKLLLENELWASIEPLVRWLGVRVSKVLSEEQRAKLDKSIALAGDFLGLSPDELVALCVLSALTGGALGAFFAWYLEIPTIPVFIGFAGGAILPYMAVSSAGTNRLKAINRGLPYVIDLMALSMSAGLDFPAATREVIEKSSNPNDPIVEELTLILQTLNLGRTRKDALLEFSRRVPTEAVLEFVNSLVQAEERGNPVAEVLLIQATVSRNRRSVRAEEAAAKAGVALAGPLMLVFFAVLGLLLGPMGMSMGSDL